MLHSLLLTALIQIRCRSTFDIKLCPISFIAIRKTVYKLETCYDDGVTQFLKCYRRMLWLDIVSMDFLPNDWSGR